jgi:MFS family permease
MRNKKIIYITQTAVMLALLIGVQLITRPFGQFVTGSLVNLILLVSVFIIGIYGGITVAVLSPVLAFLAGIGPSFIQIIPFIAVGNVLLVVVAWLIARNYMSRLKARDVLASAIGLIAASVTKFLFLWIGLVMIALPMIPGIKQKQLAMIGAAFSWPQLITALIGSILAIMIVPVLKKAVKQE